MTRSVTRWIVLAVMVCSITAACTDDQPSAQAPETTTTTPPDWVMHETGDECECADGSEFVFFSRADDPAKVMLYFQGGGACFSAETCQLEGGTYETEADADDDPTGELGIFDFENPRNPFADWSVVFVPYCTGDVHIGDATTEYSPELTIEHNGFANASAGLDFLVEEFPDAEQVFVTGSSAGGVPAPIFAGLAADALPGAEVAALADASGGYPSNAGVNGVIGGLWGAYDAAPAWPEIESRDASAYGIPDLFAIAGEHDPDIRMARFDNAYDEVQRTFAALAETGAGADGLLAVLDQNERLVEDSGTNLPVYIAPGEDHTILLRPDLYELTVERVPFVDWLTAFVAGEDPGDVRCVDCEAPVDDG